MKSVREALYQIRAYDAFERVAAAMPSEVAIDPIVVRLTRNAPTKMAGQTR